MTTHIAFGINRIYKHLERVIKTWLHHITIYTISFIEQAPCIAKNDRLRNQPRLPRSTPLRSLISGSDLVYPLISPTVKNCCASSQSPSTRTASLSISVALPLPLAEVFVRLRRRFTHTKMMAKMAMREDAAAAMLMAAIVLLRDGGLSGIYVSAKKP